MFKKYHISVLNTAAPFIFRELEAVFGEDNIFTVSGLDKYKFRNMYNIQNTHTNDAILHLARCF